MARDADQEIFLLEPLAQAERCFWRQALLAEMDAAGVRGERDIQAVVYQDSRVGRFAWRTG